MKHPPLFILHIYIYICIRFDPIIDLRIIFDGIIEMKYSLHGIGRYKYCTRPCTHPRVYLYVLPVIFTSAWKLYGCAVRVGYPRVFFLRSFVLEKFVSKYTCRNRISYPCHWRQLFAVVLLWRRNRPKFSSFLRINREHFKGIGSAFPFFPISFIINGWVSVLRRWP